MREPPAPRYPPVANVVISWNHICTLTDEGEIYCWGDNSNRVFGDGTGTDASTPKLVAGGGSDWARLDGDFTHTCAINSYKRLFCWGKDSGTAHGRLGFGSFGDTVSTPTQIGTNEDWLELAADADHTCGLRPNDELYCWGSIEHLQIGTGLMGGDKPSPTLASDWIDGVASIRAGEWTTCMLRTNGEIVCVGTFMNGLEGDGTGITVPDYYPDGPPPDGFLDIDGYAEWFGQVLGGALNKWARFDTDMRHMCAINLLGQLRCWGWNAEGQVGNGTSGNSVNTVTPITAFTNWKKVSTGYHHTCAVRDSGEAYCWGNNDYGQIGDGTSGTNRVSPTAVSLAGGWTDIWAGGYNSCGRRTDGKLYCWGRNDSDQVGDGSGINRSSPVAIAFP